jgi:hypothetical protein
MQDKGFFFPLIWNIPCCKYLNEIREIRSIQLETRAVIMFMK